MNESNALDGGGLCGACRYRSSGKPLNVRACHCRRCQKAAGSPFYPRVMVPLDSLQMTGPVRWFVADTGVRRRFCGECGRTLLSERGAPTPSGLRWEPRQTDAFAPSEHIWRSSKRQWLRFDDGLPQYLEGPPGESNFAAARAGGDFQPGAAGRLPTHQRRLSVHV